MQSLSRLRAERYSSSSGHRLSGPLLQSYHGSPRHSWKQQQKKTTSFTAVVARLVVLLLVVVGCYVGGKHYMYRRARSENKDDFFSSLGLGSGQSSFRPPSLWPSSDLGLKMPSWNQPPADPDTAAKALKGTRAGRLFGDEGTSNKQQPDRGSLGSSQFDSQQLQRGDHSPPLPPAARPPNQQQQDGEGAARTDDALLASADVRATPAPVPSTAVGADASSSQQQQQKAAATDPDFDPLHDSLTDSEKEAEQLSALSRVIQQQQDTITKQAITLQELQKRFDQQEHQLAAATATAASTNGSEGVQVEPYFPEEKVQQELTMLHKVEAQIEAVSRSVDEATKALPNLSKDQQTAQLAEIQRADQLMGRLSRVAAAINLRTSDPLTESGHDPVVELRHYYGTVANNLTLDWKEALQRQSRPSADALGLNMDPFTDSMSDLDTLDLRLEYVAAMMQGMDDSAPCKLALATTWSGDLWGLRKELIPWLTYHAYLGVSKLYVLYEGSDPRTLRELYALKPWVKVILARPPLATQAEAQAFENWVNSVPDAHIKEWKAQPGNYHLMTKQGYAVTTALQLARADNVTWLMHLDPDELLHPGASHSAGMLAGTYSLLPELCNAPAHVPSIRFTNIEGVPEAADITNRYEQVTLFRAHRHLVPPQIQPFRYIFKQGHADAWLHLYTNGKSAVRPDAPGVTQGGPHVFLGPADKRWATPDNPHGIWRPAISNSTLVLHYAYATPGDVAVKAGRSCPPGVVEAVLAGNTNQASQCFVLDLDQRAFLAAVKDRKAAGLPPVPATPQQDPATDTTNRSLPSGDIVVDPATYFGSSTSSGFSNTSWPVGQHVLNFFWGELTLSEGAPFECLTPDGKSTGWCSMKNVDKLKSLLISSGLMMRLHAPAQTMKGIETAIQQLMLLGHRRASDKSIPAIVMASSAQQRQKPQQQQASRERNPNADQGDFRRYVPPTDPSRAGADDRRPVGQGRPDPAREWEDRQDGPVGQRRWEDERMREDGQRMRAWFDRHERRRPEEPRRPGDYRGDSRRGRDGPAGAGDRPSRDEPQAINREAYKDKSRIQPDASRGVDGQRDGQQQGPGTRGQAAPRQSQEPQQQQQPARPPPPPPKQQQQQEQQQQQQSPQQQQQPPQQQQQPAEQGQQAVQQQQQQQPATVQSQQAGQQQQQPPVQAQAQKQQQQQQQESGWQEAGVPQEHVRDRNLIS